MNIIVEKLEKVLISILDAQEEKNLTVENKKIALEDLMKLLNRVYSQIIEKGVVKNIFNTYQTYFFEAINNANKKVKYPLVKINNNLWRVYLYTLFKSNNKEEILTQLTGWSYNKFTRESFTEDMKIIMLSIANIKNN